MTNKEYRAKVATYGGYDYLSRAEEKQLRRDAKVRVELNKTDVAYFDHDGKFHKTWDGYSATTLKHVNLFRKNGGLAPLNKREWVEMEMY